MVCRILTVGSRVSQCSHHRHQRYSTTNLWHLSAALDDWVRREARPISLRQLTFFGRNLNETRLLESANYVRTELPARLSHRLRDLQTLPYVVVTSQHISHVFDLYYSAFDLLRKFPEIKTLNDNDKFCLLIERTLKQHISVVPKLVMGILEGRTLMDASEIDKFMNTLLRSRISRRVIAEQHMSLTKAFKSNRSAYEDPDTVGNVSLSCRAGPVIESCWNRATETIVGRLGLAVALPQLRLEGNLAATFPYILSHLHFSIGELLSNSIIATLKQHTSRAGNFQVVVTICETPQFVIIRVCDQGGGIPNHLIPDLWSFGRRQYGEKMLDQLVEKMGSPVKRKIYEKSANVATPLGKQADSSPDFKSARLGSGSEVTTNARIHHGIGLPMSRVYAEYWAGGLELRSIEGFGVDAFLTLPRLGNKNEQLHTRARMDMI